MIANGAVPLVCASTLERCADAVPYRRTENDVREHPQVGDSVLLREMDGWRALIRILAVKEETHGSLTWRSFYTTAKCGNDVWRGIAGWQWLGGHYRPTEGCLEAWHGWCH